MALIIYGSKQLPIGVDEFLLRCPACERHLWADVIVSSKYFHVYWVPVFPFEKNASSICKTCGLRRIERPFDASFISNYSEVKNKFKHPFFTYIGAGAFAFIVCTIVLGSIIG